MIQCNACRLIAYTGRTSDDRNAISQHHMRLIKNVEWELSTPSRALPVLSVLARSGTFVDGLEQAASSSLANMTPCMTASERSFLKVVSSYLTPHPLAHGGVQALPTSTTTCSTAASPVVTSNELVLTMYDRACSGQVFTTPPPEGISSEFLDGLNFTCTLMLLELVVSKQLSAPNLDDAPIEPIVDAICRHLSHGNEMWEFRAIWWLLLVLQGDSRVFRVQVPSNVGARLFNICTRHTHQMVPQLSTEQLVLAYLSLSDQRHYERPFIVLSEIEKLLCVTPLEEFSSVPTDVLLRLMKEPVVLSTPDMSLKLCFSWYSHGRIGDMSPPEALLALHLLAQQHSFSIEEALKVASFAQWEHAHSSLFAQLFSLAGRFSLRECIAILDTAEILNVSPWGITTPSAFAERIKKAVYVESARALRSLGKSPSESLAEEVLECILSFHAMLQRCVVLPYTHSDERKITQRIQALKAALKSP